MSAKISSQYYIRTLISITLILFLCSCSINQNNSIPGLTQSTDGDIEIRETDVLIALKCQISNAFNKINSIKNTKQYADVVAIQNFKFHGGSGTFSGELKSVRTSSGTISLVVPFSGFTGTNIGPSFSESASSTNIHQVKRTFDIKQTELEHLDVSFCESLTSKHIETGEFLENSIVAAVTSMFELASQNNSSTSLTFSNSLIETTSSFSVIKNGSGGFTLKVIPSAPRLDEVSPGFTNTNENTDTFTITTKLSTKVAQTSDTRRLHICTGGVVGPRVCLEEPFTEKRYNLLKHQMSEISYSYSEDLNKDRNSTQEMNIYIDIPDQEGMNF